MKRLVTLLPASLFLLTYSSAEDRLRLDDVMDPLPEIDASVPAPHESMRLEIGERHWYHHQIIQYLDTLAESSPRMTLLGEHARSHGGRPLVSYVISTPVLYDKEPLLSGYISEENLALIAESTSVIVDQQGRGLSSSA